MRPGGISKLALGAPLHRMHSTQKNARVLSFQFSRLGNIGALTFWKERLDEMPLLNQTFTEQPLPSLDDHEEYRDARQELDRVKKLHATTTEELAEARDVPE